MNIRHTVLFVLAAALVLFGATGCSRGEETPAERPIETPAPEPDPAIESAEETPDAERPAVPEDYDEFLAQAAAQVNYTFYVPSELPPDFDFAPEESAFGPDGSSIVFALDDSRLLVMQGSFDIGDGPTEVSGISATFGPLDAKLYGSIGYLVDPESELYGAPGEAVLAADGATSYMVFGTGVSRVYILSTAREMRLFE